MLSAIGSAAWVIASVAAATALFSRYAHPARWRWRCCSFCRHLLIAIHVTPFGPVGLALFIGAALLVVRAEAAPRAELVPSDSLHRPKLEQSAVAPPVARDQRGGSRRRRAWAVVVAQQPEEGWKFGPSLLLSRRPNQRKSLMP